MSELSPSSRELLAAARPGLAPDAERVARGRDRLLAATATAAAGAAVIEAAHATVAAPPPAPAPVAAVAVKGAGLAKLALVAGAAVAVLVAVGWLVAPRSGSSPAARAPAIAPSTPPAAGEAPVAAPSTEPVAAIDLDDITLEPSAPARAAAPRSPRLVEPRVVDAPGAAPLVEPAPPPADPLTRELALLRTARAALRSGDAGASLVSLATYHREFTAGQLAEEAAALEVEAACAAGRGDVEALRAAFVRRWPTSTARARVERTCR